MGKRSDGQFERRERDFYPTPIEAVKPLIPHLPEGSFRYVEPCAGDGRLVHHLSVLTNDRAVCRLAFDVEPQQCPYVQKADVFDHIRTETINKVGSGRSNPTEMVITNPPWDRKILHPLIEGLLRVYQVVWLLFDADWPHTKQAIPYMKNLVKIVSVGRVKWIPESKMTGKDNCAWYLFQRGVGNAGNKTIFYGRQQ